jgi:hypothetical protein
LTRSPVGLFSDTTVGLFLNQAEINVKAFVFVLNTVEEKSVDDWCKLLTDLIIPALQKQDSARMRAGILKNKPEYPPYIPGNNISVRLAADKYSPLDNAITDIDVSKYFEWIAKNIGEHINADGTPVMLWSRRSPRFFEHLFLQTLE